MAAYFLTFLLVACLIALALQVAQRRDAEAKADRMVALAGQMADVAMTKPQAVRTMTGGAHDIGRERLGQVQREGHAPEHDDAYTRGELADAAVAYVRGDISLWPADWNGFRLEDRRRNLVKAGALIAAEIDRLDRISAGEAALKVVPILPGMYGTGASPLG